MMKNKKWTDADVDFLLNHWGTCSMLQFAKKLGRSVKSVRIKAYRIGLRDMVHNGNYITLNQLAQVIGKSWIVF